MATRRDINPSTLAQPASGTQQRTAVIHHPPSRLGSPLGPFDAASGPRNRGDTGRKPTAADGESTVPFAVDLIDLSSVDPAFRRRVLQEGIPWTD